MAQYVWTHSNAHRDEGKNVHANKQMDNPMQMWACCFGTEEQQLNFALLKLYQSFSSSESNEYSMMSCYNQHGFFVSFKKNVK